MTAASNSADALLRDGIARLQQAGIDDPRFDARLLLAHVLAVKPSWFLSHGEDTVPAGDAVTFDKVICERATGKPVSRIIGSRGFWTLDLALNDATLDPRPDSECLIDATIRHFPNREAPLSMIDLGTGTGCLLLAALSEFPNAWGLGIDLSPDAAMMARSNAESNDMASRTSFIAGDWTTAINGQFDLVLCNPPYIGRDETALMNREALEHDPDLALFADDKGFAAWNMLMPIFAPLTTAGGKIILECGFRQTDALAAMAGDHGLQVLETLHDLGQNPRGLVLVAK